jgi:large conductance mechanosensitive channel
MSSLLREFRDFAIKGNVVDLAVGVVIGAAFGKIVASLVGDIIMPIIGVLIGGLDFKDLAVQIGAATVAYGKFIQSCVDFLIIAASIVLAVQLINRLRRRQEEAPAVPPPPPPREEQLLTEIRDLLKERR